MEENNEFVNWAKEKLGDVVEVERERHGDQSVVHRLRTPKATFFLKVSKNLSKEKEKLEWLVGKLPIPKLIGFTVIGDAEALLLSAIDGMNLALLAKEQSPEKIVSKLAVALQDFHAISAVGCPYGKLEQGNVLVHGDACLPNFIYKGDAFSGYIDLGDMRVGNKEIDLAAAVWSLQHNLGSGHGASFLKEYGIENVTEQMVEGLRLKYEDMQKEWFLEDQKPEGANS